MSITSVSPIGGRHDVELVMDGRHARIDGMLRHIGNPAWRILAALDEDWPCPLKTHELADACEVQVKHLPKFVDYARESLRPVGIGISFDRSQGYSLVGVEYLCIDEDDMDNIDIEDGLDAAAAKDACDAHLADLRASGISAWPSVQTKR